MSSIKKIWSIFSYHQGEFICSYFKVWFLFILSTSLVHNRFIQAVRCRFFCFFLEYWNGNVEAIFFYFLCIFMLFFFCLKNNLRLIVDCSSEIALVFLDKRSCSFSWHFLLWYCSFQLIKELIDKIWIERTFWYLIKGCISMIIF